MQYFRRHLTIASRATMAAGFALLLAMPLVATTYVMPTDEELMDRAELIVIGTVEGAQSASGPNGPATDHQIRVERALKGFVLASDLLVRVQGGVSSDGLLHRVHGSPELEVGQRVLLFLNPSGGHFRVVDLELGVFTERGIGSSRTAVRHLAGTEVALSIDPKAEQRARSHKPRTFDSFAQWISDRAAGIERAPDYFVEETGGLVHSEQAFNHVQFDCRPFGGPNNAYARRVQFDNGQAVTYRAFNVGDSAIPGGGFTQIQRGLQAWNQVSASTVNLRYGGTTNNSAGGSGTGGVDRLDRVILKDPNDVVTGTFDGSGTLAVTSIVADCNTAATFANGTFINIIDADIVFQDGLDINFYPFVLDAALAFERIFTHEAGHGIGMAHSCTNSCGGSAGDAIMRANYVDSTLGRTLGSDDRQGIRFLYPAATGGAPTAPTNLEAMALTTSDIGLTWSDNSSNETGFLLQERAIASTEWSDLTILAANVTSVVVESIPEATARVYRIRANGSSDNSEFSNEAQATTFGAIGTCVEDTNTGCLTGGRFEVTARWETEQETSGEGNFSPLTSDTGTFWFFDENNVEMVVKVLDGCAINEHFWVFAGGLTNVEVEVLIVDRETGLARTFFNPLGTAFNPIQDITAFETCP